MKNEKKLKMCDGMLEDLVSSIPDSELLIAFREKENRHTKFALQDLVRAMPGLDDMDFAEELYFLVKETKQRIWDTENIKEKLEILNELINHVKNTYDLDSNFK